MRATVTIPKKEMTFVKVGDVLRTKDIGYLRRSQPTRIKQREMVCRLLKKTFKPLFKITFVDDSIPYQTRFHITAKNF
jgi:hypothetical protein